MLKKGETMTNILNEFKDYTSMRNGVLATALTVIFLLFCLCLIYKPLMELIRVIVAAVICMIAYVLMIAFVVIIFIFCICAGILLSPVLLILKLFGKI